MVALLNIGYGNVVVAARVVALISPDSAPMKRLVQESRAAARLVDATEGRRTRSILVLDSDHVVLSALSTETLAERLASPPSIAPRPPLLAEEAGDASAAPAPFALDEET